jgi:hypothetical protein
VTCAHENAEHLKPGECIATMDGIVFIGSAPCEQFRCLDCRAWLSLGAANDKPARVQVEIRAARLVAGHETANDTDDELDDPVIRSVLEAWMGFRNMSKRGEAVVEVYEAALATEAT